MTMPQLISWVVAVLTVLVAAVPVTQDRLTRFAALAGLSVTTHNARGVIDHFAALRRQRLIALVIAAPLTCFTNDLFYVVLGWCAISVFHGVRQPARAFHADEEVRIHRAAWLLSLGGAVVAGGYLLMDRGVTPALLAHAVVMLVVIWAVRKANAGPDSERAEEAVSAESAIGRWSARNLYLAGTAIVLSGALLTPGQSPRRALPEYTMPSTFPEQTVDFATVEKYKRPTCPWNDLMDVPCRSWQVNGQSFPQAAPYIVRNGRAPEQAPFVRSADKKAVVYLGRHDRRMVYQDARGVHPLTGPLADTAVPTPTFIRQSRYVALARDGAQIIDTRTWTTLPVAGAEKVHDINESGIVVTTASRVLVLDRRGKTRMSLPLRKLPASSVEDTYHLRPDGRRFVVIRGREERVETFDPETGERMSSVTPEFPGDDFLGVGWSKQGPFLIRDSLNGRVYYLDLATGKLWRKRDKALG
ncbi:hypothetical protein [Nonomuraea sp. NPDC005501]|uniref:hypothetical protein n=1 Tax=Nonomuraea sp. NPDC005501 TaxID=3156884 RepID=UPI0033B9B50F